MLSSQFSVCLRLTAQSISSRAPLCNPSTCYTPRHLSSRTAPHSHRRPTITTKVPAAVCGKRSYASKTADEIMEEITEQYATAKDEFEIAMEETEKISVYAEDDRRAAREELDKLQAMFEEVTQGGDAGVGGEVTRRVGGRIRELENAVKNMEELATNQD